MVAITLNCVTCDVIESVEAVVVDVDDSRDMTFEQAEEMESLA